MKNPDDPIRVYIGTYTAETESAGVYVGELDQLSGALGQIRPVADLVNPTYLTLIRGFSLVAFIQRVKLTRYDSRIRV